MSYKKGHKKKSKHYGFFLSDDTFICGLNLEGQEEGVEVSLKLSAVQARYLLRNIRACLEIHDEPED